MGAYNRTNDEPCCGSNLLLRQILRGKWNFKGHVVSDCWALKDFHTYHHVTADMEQSAALALKMGCDINCGSTYLYILSAYERGLVTEEEITQLEKNIAAIEREAAAAFPGWTVRRAFTSGMILRKLAQRDGLALDDVPNALTRLAEEAQKLKSLVYKREYTFSEGEGEGDASAAIQASLDEVEAQISALTAQAAQDTTAVTAGQSGVFSGQTDGFESQLTPDKLETITAAELTQLARQQPAADSGAVGKLITDATWYFVFAAGSEEAQRLHQGSSVTVRFSRDWSGEVDMTVERVGEPEEDGQCAVVLSTDRYLSETTLLRRQTVELVFDSREGIRVPTESIRVVEQTVTDPETEEESQVLTTGVFVLVGQQAEFKPVTVVEQMEEFALVVPADGVSDSEALRAGDQIILSSVELTDGAVILDS